MDIQHIRTSSDFVGAVAHALEARDICAIEQITAHVKDWLVDEETRNSMTLLLDAAADAIFEISDLEAA